MSTATHEAITATDHRHRAIFLDRDGTLVEARHYPSRPEELVIYPGVPDALRRLQTAGFRLVLVTNQSGLAHGYFSQDDLDRMHDYLTGELGRAGVSLSAIYVCPHHPEGRIPELAIACDCRKPRPGLLLQAAAGLDLDLRQSWLVGDILDDVEAGNRAGCRTVLVDLGTERPPESPLRAPTFVGRDTVHALQLIAAIEGFPEAVELDYQPPDWAEEPVLAGRGSGLERQKE